MSTSTQAQPQFEGMPPAEPRAATRSPRDRKHASNPNWLDVRPLRRWLRSYLLASSCDAQTVAAQLGKDPRILYRILRGETKSVSFRLADELLVAAERPDEFYLLYPLEESQLELDPEDERWAIADERLFGDPVYERWCRCCDAEVMTDDRALCPQCGRSTLPLSAVEWWCLSCSSPPRDHKFDCLDCGRRAKPIVTEGVLS
jgi:hypothetical protein